MIRARPYEPRANLRPYAARVPKPLRRVAFEPTPNPHAVRATLSPALAPPACDVAARSFRDPAGAAQCPVAAALFAVPGVAGVLLGPDGAWLSVNKTPDAAWKHVAVGVRRVLETWP